MFMSDLCPHVANNHHSTAKTTIIDQMAAAQALNVLKRRLSDDHFSSYLDNHYVGTPSKTQRTQLVSVVSSPVSQSQVDSPVPKRLAVFTYQFDQFI